MSDGKVLYNFIKDLPIEILTHSTDEESSAGKLTWLKNNMSNGESIGSYEDYNDTTKTYSFIEDKKLIGRVATSEIYSNIKLFTNNTVFNTRGKRYTKAEQLIKDLEEVPSNGLYTVTTGLSLFSI